MTDAQANSTELAPKSTLTLTETMLTNLEKAAGSGDLMIAKFGKFSKEGVWEFGLDREVPGETELFVVSIPSMAKGWICWVNQSPADEVMVSYLGGETVTKGSLPDHGPYNESDGWRQQSKVHVKSLDVPENVELAGSSFGFNKMVRTLAGTFAEHCRMTGVEDLAHAVPVVVLDGTYYIHKAYGRINEPRMHIVGWATEDEISSSAIDNDRRALMVETAQVSIDALDAEEDRLTGRKGKRR